MKKNIVRAISILAFIGYMIGIFGSLGEAATTRRTPRDLATLQICITMINQDARMTLDTPVVVKTRLSDKYDLTLGKVDSLLGPNLSYGDLAAVLAFTKEMSGGVKDANIDKVVKLRQSGLGWDQIARNLDLDLSDIAKSLSRFEDSTHSSVKQALAEPGLAGEAAGGTEEIVDGTGRESP